MSAEEDGLRIELRLLNGEVRGLSLGTHTGSVGNVLDRLEDWVETDGARWIQKRYIVEATVIRPAADGAA